MSESSNSIQHSISVQQLFQYSSQAVQSNEWMRP